MYDRVPIPITSKPSLAEVRRHIMNGVDHLIKKRGYTRVLYKGSEAKKYFVELPKKC